MFAEKFATGAWALVVVEITRNAKVVKRKPRGLTINLGVLQQILI